VTRIARRLRPAALAAGGLIAVMGGSDLLAALQASREKRVIVTVMNLQTGVPAKNVAAAAFALKEDRIERPVVSVEHASTPMSIVLLSDNTGALSRFSQDTKSTTQAFISSIAADRAISSVSTLTFGGAGERGLLQAVTDAARELGKRPETRRVIVSFNAVTPGDGSKVTRKEIFNELGKAGVSWFAVSLVDGGSGSALRDKVMVEVLPYSGGLRLTVQDSTKLESAIRAIAETLASQYVVTYTRASGSPKEVQIDVKGDALRAFYAHWAPK